MERSNVAAAAAAQDARVLGYDLERQIRAAERHYAEARRAADEARDQWRALLTSVRARPEQVAAARAKFEAVAARCGRLRGVIDELEERLDR